MANSLNYYLYLNGIICACVFLYFLCFFFSLLTVLTIHIIANALSVLLPEDKHVIKRQLYSKPFTL